MIGLAPSSTHQVHIYAGTCQNPGPLAVSLGQLEADSAGTINKDIVVTGRIDATTHTAVTAIPAGKWDVSVHTGSTLAIPDQFRPLLCGNIVHGGASASAEMAPPPGTGNNVSGSASLTLDANTHTMSVEVKLSGMAPDSTHPDHIHVGGCSAQGPVRYPLRTIKTDAVGTADITTTINDVNSIAYGLWYLNIHRGPGLDTQEQFTPIACGDVARGQ